MSSISEPIPDEPIPDEPIPDEPIPDLRRAAASWSAELDGLDVTSFMVAATVQRLSQHIERAFVAVARRHRLGPGDLRILLALRRSGPRYAVSPTELFRRLLITSGAVSKQVDRLVEVGLVTRVADPDTLRGLLVRLEPGGRAIADAAMREICSDFLGLERLDPEQARRALDALGELQAVMERGAPAPLVDAADGDRR
ncbi:MAG TPA: MarR family winged helix-turn-helix transcriptional regulator [Pseudonocardia sp.]|nr:MarR family winged helix-turn-helix transcriptional regulator [Pseudonocardia sp.]